MSSGGAKRRSNGGAAPVASADGAATPLAIPSSAVTPTGDNAQQNTSSGGVRKRKTKKPPNRQQIMLMQMKAQQELEKEQGQVVQAYAGGAFSEQLLKLLRTVLIVVVIGGALLYFYEPGLVAKWLRRKPELPARSLISLYPPGISIRRDLPKFFYEYSIATPANLPARDAVRHIAALRKMATNPGSKYKQTIKLWPWELDQFRSQLPDVASLDDYCGKGTDTLYKSRPELREDVVLWCLLGAGHDHGLIRYGVQQVFGSVSRGIKGVAVKYDGHQNRAMARSLLLLPFHAPEKLKKGKPLPPSTRVASAVMSWLRQNAPLIADMDELMVAMEEYLHSSIKREPEDSWHWLYAACTATERLARQDDPRVASMCTKQQEEQGDDCCVIYDPNLFAFYGRRRAKSMSE